MNNKYTAIEMNSILSSEAITEYKKQMYDCLHRVLPGYTRDDLLFAIDDSISKHFRDREAELDNSYTNTTTQTTALKMANYIISRKPIFTAAGTIFQHHGDVPNPFYDLIDGFIMNRENYKNMMKAFPKGSSEFAKYNLFQSIEKICANAMYGASGKETSIFFCYYMATSITGQGRSLISSAIMMVEEFLSNNVKFENFNEVVTFIHHVCTEKRTYDDSLILDEDIDLDLCLAKLVASCGFNYIPTEKHIKLLRRILGQLSQQDWNRLYYRNNLYYFCDNKYVTNMIRNLMGKFSAVYMDPNGIPKEVSEEMDEFYNLLHEYVYHPYIIQDATDRSRSMIRDISILTDTDSTFVSLEGWYRYINKMVGDMDMPLRHIQTDVETGETEEAEEEAFPENIFDPTHAKDFFPDNVGFDYDRDEIIERHTTIRPDKICADRGVKITITNIMSNIIYRIQKEYMKMYCAQFNTVDGDFNKTNKKLDSDCIIILKNEFALKKSLIKTTSKTYATVQERQEECLVPENACLDIKGMMITKACTCQRTKDKVKSILYSDILNSEDVDIFRVVEKLSILEKEIYNTLHSGDTYYYRPARIKSMRSYTKEIPYTFRAAYAYNTVRRSTDEALDLTERNTILLVNTIINEENVDDIKDTFPEVYNNMKMYLQELRSQKEKKNPSTKYKPKDIEISYIGIPSGSVVPDWCIPFINYTQIINDNMKAFPCDDIGLKRQLRTEVNYSNMVSF